MRHSEFGAELRALSREVMRSYARYYLETFRLQIIPDERIRAGMHVNQENVDLTLEHMKNGRGVIYALPHMGDFEQAGRWVILVGAGSIAAPSPSGSSRSRSSRSSSSSARASGWKWCRPQAARTRSE